MLFRIVDFGSWIAVVVMAMMGMHDVQREFT